MPPVTRTRTSAELLKILSDGEWHSTTYLALAAGKYIPPEIASRRCKKADHPRGVEIGRYSLINLTLDGMVRNGRIEKRRTPESKNEWRMVDREWVEKSLHRFEDLQVLVMTPSLVPAVRTVDLGLTEYSALLEAKLAYESTRGSTTEWGTFLLLLLGFAIGGKLLKPRR